MKRILFLHQVSSVGGGSYCLLNVVKAIDKKIWEPIVALKNHGPLEDEFKKIGVKVVLFPQMKVIPYNRKLTLRTMIKYIRIIQSEDAFYLLLQKEHIDVVYLNNMMIAPYLRPAKKNGCKTVLHVREHWPLNEHKKQLEWIRGLVYENCDCLIAINNYSASIFPRIESTIVYDWIDMDSRYKPMPISEIFGEDMSGKKMFLFLGGMQRIKGIYEVVRTFSEVFKEESYRLLILGIDNNKKTDGIKSIVKNLLFKFGYPHYSSKVRNLIIKDKRIKCIPSFFEITDVLKQSYCVLSYFTIPHANLSLAESIILEVPSIAAQTEESEEYSLNGKLAILYPINNIESFKNTLLSFEDRRCELKNRLSSRERLLIEELFSENRNKKNLNDALYKLVII